MKNKKQKLAKWLLSKLTPYKEIITLDKASDDYAEMCCQNNHWRKFANDGLLTREFVAISHAFMNGYILCMHQNDLKFENGLIIKNNKLQLPTYMEKMIDNEEKEQALESVREVLGEYLSEYNIQEIMNKINQKINEKETDKKY